MMKTFKDIISEVAEPTARREKEFKDKHVVQKINHPVTDMDALTAKSAKKDKTKKASLHGDEDEAVYEEKMSDAEMKKREGIVMGMKKSKADLKKRYGDRWKSVMYATATKNAMKEEVELDEGAKEKALKALMTKALGGKRAKAGYTSAVAQNGDFVVKDGGSRIVGRIKAGSFTDPLKEEVELEEAPRRRKGAPKITGDSIAIQRAKDAEHNKAMGRTKTGRKKPVRQMTSTQRSLASMRKEEIELDEDITKMSHGRLKWHMNTGVPHGSYTKDEMKKERDRRLSRVDTHAAYKKAKAGLSEEVESLDEAFKAGSMKLADGSSVKVTAEQANVLNSLFQELNSSNKKKMEERLMSSSKGFNEILSFAKEAL